jgi:hypothetical protein
MPQTLYYHNFPSSWIFYSILVEVLGIKVSSPDLLIAVAPTIWQLLFLFPLYCFLRKSTYDGTNSFWIGLWIFYLGNWLGQSYISAQTFGFLLFLFILALSLEKESKTYGLCTVILYACLCQSHLLSSLMGLAIFITLVFFKKKSPVILMISGTFLIFWWIYGATVFFESNLPLFFELALKFDILFRQGLSYRLYYPNEAHRLIASIRFLDGILLFSLGFTGVILTWRKLGKEYFKGKDGVTAISWFTCFLIIVLISAPAGGEIFERSLLFSLPFIGFFTTKLLTNKVCRIITCILILLFLPLHFICQYGNQIMDYISPSHKSALHFFYEKTSPGYIISQYSILPGFTKYPFKYSWKPFPYQDLKEKKLSISEFIDSLEEGKVTNSCYISIGYSEMNFYYWHYNDQNFMVNMREILTYSPKVNLVFSNKGFELFTI